MVAPMMMPMMMLTASHSPSRAGTGWTWSRAISIRRASTSGTKRASFLIDEEMVYKQKGLSSLAFRAREIACGRETQAGTWLPNASRLHADRLADQRHCLLRFGAGTLGASPENVLDVIGIAGQLLAAFPRRAEKCVDLVQ